MAIDWPSARVTMAFLTSDRCPTRPRKRLVLPLTFRVLTLVTVTLNSASTAEAISVGISAWAEAAHFGNGAIDAPAMAANLVGAIVKDPAADTLALEEYLENVVRKRDGWKDLYGAIRDVM